MAAKGPQSKASKEIATLAEQSDAFAMKYPEPAPELSNYEAEVWREVVRYKAPDWFDGSTYPLLIQYCRHTVRANRIAQMILAIEDDIDRRASGQATILPLPDLGYLDLIRAQQAESRALAMLATKMRLSHQSTIDDANARNRVGKKSATGGGALWE